MATSGSTNFSLNGNQLLYAAFYELGIYAPGETPDVEDVNYARQKFNLMQKAWQAEGIFLWLKQNCTLFLAYNQESYDLGATGDPCVTALVETALAADAASGASSVTVDSISGLADNYALGIELDDGTLQWTAVNGTPSGVTVAFDDALTDDAGDGNAVFAYATTAQIGRPMEILNARYRDSGGNEIPCTFLSEAEYHALPQKDTLGSPLQLYYDPQLTNGVLYTWPTADAVDGQLKLTVKREIDDLDAITDDVEFPKEWQLPVIYNLAVELIPSYGKRITRSTELLISLAEKYKKTLQKHDSEAVGVRLRPSTRGRTIPPGRR